MSTTTEVAQGGDLASLLTELKGLRDEIVKSREEVNAGADSAVQKALAAMSGADSSSLAQKALAEGSAAHQSDEAERSKAKDVGDLNIWIKGAGKLDPNDPVYATKALHALHASPFEDGGYRAEAVKNMKQAANEFLFAYLHANAKALTRSTGNVAKPYDPRDLQSYHRLQDAVRTVGKAYTLNTAEPWIPEQFDTTALPPIFSPRELGGRLVQTDMPSVKYRRPVMVQLGELCYLAELGPLADTDVRAKARAVQAGVDKAEFVAKRIAQRIVIDDNAEESTVISAMPAFMLELNMNLAKSGEEIFVNGDVNAGGAGALDTATPADCRAAQAGFRKWCFANSTSFSLGGTGKFKPDCFGQLRAYLDQELQGDPAKLLWVMSTAADNIAMSSTDWTLFQASYATNEARASAINGPCRNYNGTDAITSIALKDTMTNAGVWSTSGTQGDGVGNGAFTGVLCVRTDAWSVGRFGGPKGQVVYDPITFSYSAVVSQSLCMAELFPGQKSASYGYNVIK